MVSGRTAVSIEKRNRGTRAMLSKRVSGTFASSLFSSRFSFLSTLLLAAIASSAGAQQYQADPVDKTARAYSANARQWLANPGAYTADKAHFDDYFNKYYFPDM